LRSSPRAPRTCPAGAAEAIKARIAEQVASLLDASSRFDPDRPAPGSDPDRQQGRHSRGARSPGVHVAQAKRLIADGQAVGRRLDFLSQELNREANTLCSKSNDVALTNIGLELKTVVEQFREQVQNLE
jgi:hypothetical protein